ncbi:MAG: Hemin transport system permease protein HmuU [Betaproteobacteria bacterium ADurb.Bin341]|nr:MAG: Hemin transport system permease protein HmuU [Betaproteobacteria bacterium ADurb.Bin341]
MPSRRRALLILTALLTLAFLSIGLALSVGSLPIGFGDVLAVLLRQETPGAEIVRLLRLPRALLGFACGGLLAFAGTLMQVLLRNPLADPYVLGVSGGASIGALAAILLGFSGLGIDTLAFGGALATLLLVFGLAHGDGSWTQTRLLLTGVIVAAGCGAIVALLLAIAPEQQLRGMLFWLMGDLSNPGESGFTLGVLALCLVFALPFARELNLLSRGTDTARALGVAVSRLHRLIYFLAAVATAVAVSQAGAIGFVGLIVPHLVRLVTGNDQRLLLPASVLAGGSLLVIADTLARSIAAPQQLPVGVLTALIGVPVFLLLLGRHPR